MTRVFDVEARLIADVLEPIVPPDVAAGDLLRMVLRFEAPTTFRAPAGWTVVEEGPQGREFVVVLEKILVK